jgi:hypothetical protein
MAYFEIIYFGKIIELIILILLKTLFYSSQQNCPQTALSKQQT